MRASVGLLVLFMAIGPTTVRAQDKDDLAKRAKLFFTTHCYRCHGQNGANEGGFGYVTDLKQLVETKKVNPNDPAKSKIFKKISPDLVGDMPADSLTKPTAEDIVAFEAAAGGWKDVDVDRFLRDNAESRHLPSRPPINL